MNIALVVANPTTSETFIASQITTLEELGHRVQVVDLRPWAPRPVRAPLPVRVVRVLLAGPMTTRGLRGQVRSTVDGADLVVAGDHMSVRAVWSRRRHTSAPLLHGTPAAVTWLRLHAQSASSAT
jgi:hypothetical protein